MDCYKIIGANPLNGSVSVEGAKNAALPIMAAALLASEPVVLDNVPRLADVATLARLLRGLGVRLARTGGTFELLAPQEGPIRADEKLVRRMRASFCVLGPLLARRGRAVVPLPGGCQLGPRPVDLHLRALAALGADLRVEHGRVVASAARLRGATLFLHGPHGPSVTGTANALCAAVLARGTTSIVGAAQEPEIEDLGRFLVSLGARIEGLGSDALRIHGVDQLGGTRHTIIPDRIEAGTFLLAATATGGKITVRQTLPEHLAAVLGALEATGARIRVTYDTIELEMSERPRGIDLVALPYPGIPTDLLPLWLALLSRATGTSRLADDVFPHRWLHVDELRRLGTQVSLRAGLATVRGVEHLEGTQVVGRDLRGAAALLVAGLSANGVTTLTGLHHLRRGYARLEEKLSSLNGRVASTSAPLARRG